MSRWLYTFAVLTPSTSARVADLLAPNANGGETIDEWLIRLLLTDQSELASFKAIMDGWNGLNHLFHFGDGLVSVTDPILKKIFRRAREGHWAQLVPPSELRSVQESSIAWRERAETELGFYATRDFVLAARDWMRFSQATECPAFFSARVLGASLDDSDFQGR